MLFGFSEEDDYDDEDMEREDLMKDTRKDTATVTTTDVPGGEASTSLLLDNVTSNKDTQATQDITETPLTPDVRARSSSSSELMSPMHDHTYALPSLLITPTMMATIDSHSLSHKGYTCLSKVGQITAPPQPPAENTSLKKSVEFLKEAHGHLGT